MIPVLRSSDWQSARVDRRAGAGPVALAPAQWPLRAIRVGKSRVSHVHRLADRASPAQPDIHFHDSRRIAWDRGVSQWNSPVTMRYGGCIQSHIDK